MKRLLLTGLLFLGIGQLSSFAQSGGSYTDDIYYSSEDAKKDAEAQKKKDAEAQARREQSRQNEEYSSSDPNYQSDGDYIDYDDDSYYSSRFRRFNAPYWGMGYYSGFYDPWWGWGSPMGWGYNNWYNPGFSVGVGWGGGPYWNSGFGYYNWYGYPGFYSAYNYPFYGGGWGGYWNGYNDGFYNGYYAGGGWGGAPVRTATYGPRYSPAYSGLRNAGPGSGRSEPGLRRTAVNNGQLRTAPRGNDDNRSGAVGSRPSSAPVERVRGVRNNNFQTETPAAADNDVRMENNRGTVQESRPSRGRFFSNDNAVTAQPRQEAAQPRQEVSQQHYERSQPSRSERYSAPSRSSESGRSYSAPSRSYSSPSRSSGSSGGGSFRGGRR